MWSEPDSVAYTESVASWWISLAVYISWRRESTGVQDRMEKLGGGVPEHHQGERERAGHRQDQDIVQRSASEQAQYSPSIWYSIFV